jgi:hypothetical protein
MTNIPTEIYDDMIALANKAKSINNHQVTHGEKTVLARLARKILISVSDFQCDENTPIITVDSMTHVIDQMSEGDKS